MTIEQIIEQALAQRFPDADTMKDIGLKLGEESGEVQGAIVKLPEGRKTEQDLKDEIGDVLICLSRLAAKLGMTLDELRIARWRNIEHRLTDYARRQAEGCPDCTPFSYCSKHEMPERPTIDLMGWFADLELYPEGPERDAAEKRMRRIRFETMKLEAERKARSAGLTDEDMRILRGEHYDD